MFQYGALRALILGAALWVSATAAQAAQADPQAPAASPAQPSFTPAILRDKDLGPTVPQMSARVWSELRRVRGRAIRAAQEPAARAT
ncbi:hypothetical protein LJR225_001458 [Phenylobacterium sp. LjRoot225]|uniref:hypothetical protein n=1 Tax=Phenylobacterium sp. LjRoot225 TaxID=3342285 RepID=UPI003ECCCC08